MMILAGEVAGVDTVKFTTLLCLSGSAYAELPSDGGVTSNLLDLFVSRDAPPGAQSEMGITPARHAGLGSHTRKSYLSHPPL